MTLQISANRNIFLDVNFNFDEILGECCLYFNQQKGIMNDNGNRVSAFFEFVLAIHLVSIDMVNNNNIVYRTPIKICTLSLSLNTFKKFLEFKYGINPTKLINVSKVF
jgi:hypothetical protein